MKRKYILIVVFFALFACQPPYQIEGQKDIVLLNEMLNDISNYPTVTIEGKTWLAKNLAVTEFSNGDTIFYAHSSDAWTYAADNNIPAWAYQDFYEPFDAEMAEVRYYNWHAVNDPRGLAPKGWKVPSLEDWNHLLRSYAISKEKTMELRSEDLWDTETDDKGNNVSSFNAKPYGYCGDYGGFANIRINAIWWTSDAYNEEEAWQITLNTYNDLGTFESEKGAGYNVRLVKLSP